MTPSQIRVITERELIRAHYASALAAARAGSDPAIGYIYTEEVAKRVANCRAEAARLGAIDPATAIPKDVGMTPLSCATCGRAATMVAELHPAWFVALVDVRVRICLECARVASELLSGEPRS